MHKQINAWKSVENYVLSNFKKEAKYSVFQIDKSEKQDSIFLEITQVVSGFSLISQTKLGSNILRCRCYVTLL